MKDQIVPHFIGDPHWPDLEIKPTGVSERPSFESAGRVTALDDQYFVFNDTNVV